MTQQIRIWNVASGGDLEEVRPERLDLEDRLEKWIERDPSVLDPGLLVIGRQVATAHGGYIDLVCMDEVGDLVVVELKRDRTPRDVVAQTLDYASWICGLCNEDVRELAADYLGGEKELEARFRTAFGSALPDLLNESHRLLIVGSNIDAATERILSYLSEQHGVPLNALRFAFFRDQAGREYLARVFLMEPEAAERRSQKTRSKRSPRLTDEELEAQATRAGCSDTYRGLVDGLSQVWRAETTRSSRRFLAPYRSSQRVVLSLLPGESDRVRGLRYQIYFERLKEILQLEHDEAMALLPGDSEEWRNRGSPDDPEWAGFAGFFRNPADVERFVAAVRR